ncbi:YcaO-like family protein [Kibdelosporangium philippinense]|uniref:YcaO-like family protein n=1 Tax=Kibdelosporangium philippinense TaxID=211113 RepID=A0ABS8Z5R6_9PSEU|nr:YcaO-like family protein [Kibdelosporangium philippinense]MCE7001976.1 YcaO-like family protein [Kibdelosporangium philippinense]
MTLTTDALIDPLTGIVRRLVDVEPVAGIPSSYVGVTAEVSDARRLGAWPADRVSLGTSFGDIDTARAAALGEAVERYCGNRVPLGLRVATARDLLAGGQKVLGPADLPFFDKWQYDSERFPYRPFADDVEIAWAQGIEGGEPCFAPASWVYLNYHTASRRAEPRLHHLNYAGIATGLGERDAFERGLLELIERDALELWWHLGGPTTGIDIASVPWLAERLAGSRLQVHLVQLPSEYPVSVVAAVVIDPETGIVGGGGAARFDPAHACTKAVLEAIHTWVFTLGLLDPAGWVFKAIEAGVLAEGLYLSHRDDRAYLADAGDNFRRVRDLGAQVQIWLDPAVQDQWSHRFTAPTSIVHCGDLPAGDLDALTTSLAGNRIATFDLTTPDVAETPLRVVRVCATGLVPNAPAAFRYLGLPRWQQAIDARGWDNGVIFVPPPFL